MRLIGVYKTREAAQKAKRTMRERGIPSERTSLLSPDDTHGPHLAVYADHRASQVAWVGALLGGTLGGLVLGGLMVGEVEFEGFTTLMEGHLVAFLVGFVLAAVPGALIGAAIGWRQPTLKADFFDADEKRGGTALGVITLSDDELETARYAFRSTGALQVRTRRSSDIDRGERSVRLERAQED